MIENGKTILFIGDSITAGARNTHNHGPLGCGYASLFSDLLTIRRSGDNYRLINNGIDGNTVGHLLSRWADDVYSYRPDVLVVLIGINDAARFIEKSPSYHLSPTEFGETYAKLITETKAVLPETEILLIEPFYLTTGKNPAGSYRNNLAELLTEYIKQTREVASTRAVKLCAINRRFHQILQYKSISLLSDDCVHLTRAGHLLLAEELYAILFG